MKIIFSRKGFDAENGGTASPVMPDGTMLSMPIPSNDDIAFADLTYGDRSYQQILNELKPNNGKLRSKYCHLDPDLRMGNRSEVPEDWRPIFGQADAAQSHLANQDVAVGDVFLFFGWFKETEEKNGMLKYKKGAKDSHMIYGYLQIGEIVKNDGLTRYPWHPHSHYWFPGDSDNSNTMYIASERLVVDGVDTGLPGAGTLRYSDELVLTMPGQTKSRWLLPEFFKEVSISCHSIDSFKPEGYFQTVRIGQEFVVSEDERVTKWALDLIRNNYHPEFSGFDVPVKGCIVSSEEFVSKVKK